MFLCTQQEQILKLCNTTERCNTQEILLKIIRKINSSPGPCHPCNQPGKPQSSLNPTSVSKERVSKRLVHPHVISSKVSLGAGASRSCVTSVVASQPPPSLHPPQDGSTTPRGHRALGLPGREEEPAPSFPNSLPAFPSRKAETGGGTPMRRCGLRAQGAGEVRCACRCRCRGADRGGARASAGTRRAREPNTRSPGTSIRGAAREAI